MIGAFSRRRSLRIAVMLLLNTLSACTLTIDVPEQPVSDLPRVQPVPLSVGLYLSPELRAAKWEGKLAFDTFLIPLGPAFATNSLNVAQKAFTEVVPVDSASAPPASVSAVLIPKLVSVERNQPVFGYEDETTTVVYEWRMQRPDGALVWVNTITAEGTAARGAIAQRGAAKQVELMLSDLFSQSLVALTIASEIRALAAGR